MSDLVPTVVSVMIQTEAVAFVPCVPVATTMYKHVAARTLVHTSGGVAHLPHAGLAAVVEPVTSSQSVQRSCRSRIV